jgi:V/A-type H+-transporting ATPase subunit D
MSKIKHTKNELKAQRDALRRFERYLPTLQLKKHQLQIEVRQLDGKIEARAGEERSAREELRAWVKLYSEPFDFETALALDSVQTAEGNIAGVTIPLLEQVSFRKQAPDLFATPAWVDDGVQMLERLLRLGIERAVLAEQHRLLAEELRTTSQRVNLFEKVKIPESRENIRVIRIFLGDQQTADVARSKIAKGRSVEKVRSA